MSSQSHQTSALDAGRTAGEYLLDPALSLTASFAGERKRLSDQLLPIDQEIARLELREARSKEWLASAKQRMDEVNQRLAAEQQTRDKHPAAHSRIRGAVYVSMSVLVLVADFVILSQLVGAMFGLSQRSAGGGGPITSLTNPAEAFQAFGEVYITTIGILLFAMAFKVYKDRVPPARDGASSWHQKAVRALEGVGVAVAMALAASALVAVSMARLAVDFGAQQGGAGSATRWVTTIIGIAAPFVAVLLFSRGMDAFSAGSRVRALESMARKAGKAFGDADKEQMEIAQELATKRLERDSLREGDRLGSALVTAAERFRTGYAAAVTEVLNSAGTRGTYRRLRSRLIIPDTQP